MDSDAKDPTKPIKYDPHNVVDKQIIRPMSVGSSSLSNTNIKNAGVALAASLTVNNGQSLTLTTTDSSSVNAGIRLVGNYQVVFFQDSVSDANMIPFVNVTGWAVYGPFAMPEAITGFTKQTDGNNLVFRTIVSNSTGSNHTVIAYTDLRFQLGVGGQSQ